MTSRAARILVVEQNEAVEHMVRSLLKRNGYTVNPVNSAFTALETVRTSELDAVVISADFLVPDGGWIVGEQIWEVAPDLPVIVLTEHGHRTPDTDDSPKGPHATVKMPLGGNELITVLESLIARGGV